MLLNILQIPEIGMSRSFSSTVWTLRAVETALDGKAVKAAVSFELSRYGRRVSVSLHFDIQGYTTCSRCMQSILISVQGSEELTFDEDPGSKVHPKTEKELGKIAREDEIDIEELDIGWYQNGKLSLEDVLCEAIVLNLPMRMYCGLPISSASGADCQHFETEIPKTSNNLLANLFKIE